MSRLCLPSGEFNWLDAPYGQMVSQSIGAEPNPWTSTAFCCKAFKNFRCPLVCINHKNHAGQETIDDIYTVLAWSYKHLAAGTFPVHGHDGKAFESRKRRQWSGKPLLVQGILAEVRGDWKYFKEAFRFPQFNEVAGCCWKCTVKPDGIRSVGLSAPWRQERLGHWQFLQRTLELGKSVSPIFLCPELTVDCFLLDWLHCMDQGVSADWLGNLLWYLVSHKLPGASQSSRCKALYLKIKEWYASHPDVPSKYDDMKTTMLRQKGLSPKLRGKAGEVRGLIGFGSWAADEYLSGDDPFEQAIKIGMGHLQTMYNMLSQAAFDQATLQEHSRKFALQAVAIEAASPPDLWAVKPKLHLMQELCEMCTSNPSTHWLYRDEEFGGSCAQLGQKRGGQATPGVWGQTVLLSFLSMHNVPCIK